MKRREAIVELKRHTDAIKALGATSLYLFGSVARDEAKARSDLDLFVDYDPESKFSLLELVGIKLLLEKSLGIAVDVTTRDSLHPTLRGDIEQSAVRVFCLAGNIGGDRRIRSCDRRKGVLEPASGAFL